MHFIWGLCRRARNSIRLVTSRVIGTVRPIARPRSGKGARPVLLVGAPLVALAATAFGFLHIGASSRPAYASSRHDSRRAGPGDWWSTTVGRASSIGQFVDDAARNQWYATLLFDAPHPQPVRSGAHYAHGSSTGACGGATNGADQYIARESGGDPGAVNSGSGAYGCYQIMPSTWAASCSDLGSQSGSSASTQAQCASRLPSSAWAG